MSSNTQTVADAAGNISNASNVVTVTFENTAAVTAPAVSVTRGGFRRNAGTGRYEQSVTLKNTSAVTVPGAVSLVLDGLRA